MKKILFSIFLFFVGLTAFSQYLPINVILNPNRPYFPKNAKIGDTLGVVGKSWFYARNYLINGFTHQTYNKSFIFSDSVLIDGKYYNSAIQRYNAVRSFLKFDGSAYINTADTSKSNLSSELFIDKDNATITSSGILTDNHILEVDSNRAYVTSTANDTINLFCTVNKNAINFFNWQQAGLRYVRATDNMWLQNYNGGLNFSTFNNLRWSIISTTGVLQSNGAQTIKTSTGDLTLSTGAANGNILLNPNGTGVLNSTSAVTAGSGMLNLTNIATSGSTAGSTLSLICNDGAALASGDRLGGLRFYGSYDASNNLALGASIMAVTNAAFSSATNAPTNLTFNTQSTSGILTERMKIDHTGQTGIGTSTVPAALISDYVQLNVFGNKGAGDLTTGRVASIAVNNNAGAGGFRTIKARGTVGALATLIDGEFMGINDFWGYDGTAAAQGASIVTLARGTWSNTSHPVDMYFATCAASSTTVTERWRITSTGVFQALGGTNQTIQIGRSTVASAAGADMTILAGSTTSGTTNGKGGDVYIGGGISSGSNVSRIYLQTADGLAASTSDNTVTTKVTVMGNGGLIYAPKNTGNVVAGTGITAAMCAFDIRYNGNSAIDISANPQIAAGTDGQVIKITGLSDTNTLLLEDGNGLQLAGGVSFTLGAGDVIQLHYVTSLSVWVEDSRSDN